MLVLAIKDIVALSLLKTLQEERLQASTENEHEINVCSSNQKSSFVQC